MSISANIDNTMLMEYMGYLSILKTRCLYGISSYTCMYIGLWHNTEKFAG